MHEMIVSRSKGDYRRPTAAICRTAHKVLYTKKHTQMNALYPAMDISCMPSRGKV